MYHIEERKPVKCGSLDIIKPVNQDAILLQCVNCGHEKRRPEPKPDHHGYSFGTHADNPFDTF